METLFSRADILLPRAGDMTSWSVIACDQFTAEPAYWEALERERRGVPSTLHLMLPEAYLTRADPAAAAARIHDEMRRYLAAGIFREIRDSFIYVERAVHGGLLRRGLLGVLDLEAYDYSATSRTPVRATEDTIESRLPPRARIREGAPLEMPHILVFMDDPDDRVLGPLRACAAAELPLLYDFSLCAGGGHIRGYQVSGARADAADAALAALADPAALRAWYGNAAPVVFATGDGNHSLAAAKQCWAASIRPHLTAAERESHPARFALVELVNIHDPAVTFEPIHRVLFDTDPAAFAREARERFAARPADPAADLCQPLRLVTPEGEETLYGNGLLPGELVGAAERLCQRCAERYGGSVDYIHNDETARAMGSEARHAALLLPRMEKKALFASVAQAGPFPKKSFSIGRAQDKRYYLECRKIIREA